MLRERDPHRVTGTRRWAAPAALALASVAAPKPARAEQFVVVDETYTATAANTDDSHYRVNPRAGTPTNWRSPVDFASGRAHARLEVLEKPSTRKTLYNICYEATPSYACMAYSPAYTAPGVYDFEFPFSTFYQYSMVDWSKGVRKVALILKDENEIKKQGDAAFYPTKIHITITIVAPGSTYVPPMPTTMADAGVEMDAALPNDGGVSADAGVSDAATGTGMGTGLGGMGLGGVSGTTAWGTAGSGGRSSVGAGAGGAASAGDTGAHATSGTGALGATPGASPPATPPSSPSVSGTGCAVSAGRSRQELLWLWLGTSLLLFRRASVRRRPRTQGDIYG